MTAPKIRQLDNRLANQIAAGEVVERPASVVKELLENAIDAQASVVSVDIEEGGVKRIRITDNGIGIDDEDLPLALARHATSKIASIDDLEAVATLGFRGEALASIASVSKLSITSNTSDLPANGRSAYCEGREMQVSISPQAHLGHNARYSRFVLQHPARRKFLRTERTEYARIEEVVKRTALAHPEVAFVLSHNGKVIQDFPLVPQMQICNGASLAYVARPSHTRAWWLTVWLTGYRSVVGWVSQRSPVRKQICSTSL